MKSERFFCKKPRCGSHKTALILAHSRPDPLHGRVEKFGEEKEGGGRATNLCGVFLLISKIFLQIATIFTTLHLFLIAFLRLICMQLPCPKTELISQLTCISALILIPVLIGGT